MIECSRAQAQRACCICCLCAFYNLVINRSTLFSIALITAREQRAAENCSFIVREQMEGWFKINISQESGVHYLTTWQRHFRRVCVSGFIASLKLICVEKASCVPGSSGLLPYRQHFKHIKEDILNNSTIFVHMGSKITLVHMDCHCLFQNNLFCVPQKNDV